MRGKYGGEIMGEARKGGRRLMGWSDRTNGGLHGMDGVGSVECSWEE